MTQVFADTSYYVALSSKRDQFHETAVDFAQHYRGTILTTEYVLIELGNWLSQSDDRPAFISLLQQLEHDRGTIVVPSDRSLFERGIDLFVDRPDKEWSMTDCISFVVKEEQSITGALSADHHFEQAGFVKLLK